MEDVSVTLVGLVIRGTARLLIIVLIRSHCVTGLHDVNRC